jgi:nickel-type superoxide dismutase maturation protease
MRLPWRAVAVTGESMLPTLRPGDWLLVRLGASVAVGDVVVARHPYEADVLTVKRIAFREGEGEGGAGGGGWWLESDNQKAPGRQDSWDWGAVPDDLIVGRVALRYWPVTKVSRLRTVPT